jgi:hypothetical protein
MKDRAASYDPLTGLAPAIALKVASLVKMHWAYQGSSTRLVINLLSCPGNYDAWTEQLPNLQTLTPSVKSAVGLRMFVPTLLTAAGLQASSMTCESATSTHQQAHTNTLGGEVRQLG